MIPLLYFLYFWFAAIALFGLMSLLSVMQMVRFGVAGFGTYVSTAFFLTAAVIAIFGTSYFFLSIDWSQSIDIFGGMMSSINIVQ